MTKLGMAFVCVTVFMGLHADRAWAIKQFQKEFLATYVDEEANPEFAALVKETKCDVCHDSTKRNEKGKKSKKFHNPYGEELSKLLDKKEHKKDVEKIREALETVAKISSDAADPSSPTYGELLAEGKLPSPLPPSDEEEASEDEQE